MLRKLGAAVSGLAARLDALHAAQQARLLQHEGALLELQERTSGEVAMVCEAADDVANLGQHMEACPRRVSIFTWL